VFVASCDFSFFEGGFEFDFPAKFEELLFKMFSALVVWGLLAKPALPFDVFLFLEFPRDLSGKLASPVGDLFLESTSIRPPADGGRLA